MRLRRIRWHDESWPEWMATLEINVLQKPILPSARLKGLGVVIGIAIAVMAIFALTHAIKRIDGNSSGRSGHAA